MSRIKLHGDIVGLDLGASRTGVARLNTVARIAEPLEVIDMKSNDLEIQVAEVVNKSGACAIVAGLPRGLDGQVTDQTKWAEKVVEKLQNSLNVPVFTIDEAGTTKKAESIIQPNQSIDSVAAGVLLEDFAGEVLAGRIENVSF